MTAFDGAVRWSAAGTPPSAAEIADERGQFHAAVARLAHRQLTELVVDQAMKDRLFAATLLRRAGLFEATYRDCLLEFRQVLREVVNVTNGDRWQIHDIEAAGRRLVDEVTVLCAHPATPDLLDLVEQAIVSWDDLVGYLIDAYDVRTLDPDEISDALIDAHHDLCAQLDLPPAQLKKRLTNVIGQCHCDTIRIDAYADLLSEA